MAKGKLKETATYQTRPIEPAGRTKSAVVLRPLMGAYRLPGRKGDVVEVPVDMVDEMVEKKYIELT